MPDQPPIQKPRIYLRNRAHLREGMQAQFFKGQQDLIKNTARSNIDIVAAAATKPFYAGATAPSPLPQIVHFWEVPEWSSLYKAMYAFSESDWYRSQLDSLQVEHQDLLAGVDIGRRPLRRPPQWKDDKTPGYSYVYEEIRLQRDESNRQFLRDVNWLAEWLAPKIELLWLALEVTGTPSQFCALWRVPDDENTCFDAECSKLAYQTDASGTRYARLMARIDRYSREVLYPESTELFANNVHKEA